MSPSDRPKSKRVLLIGPLPPPNGGSRVSFDRFLRYVEKLPHLRVTHADFPVRKRGRGGQIGGVAPFRTLIRGVGALLRLPMTDRVVLFSSRGMAFSYGLILIGTGRLFGKPVCLRLFGGRPYLSAISRNNRFRHITEWLLSRAASISLETEIGRNDFPESVRRRVTSIPGYRPKPGKTTPRSHTDGCFRFVFAGRVDASKGIDVLLSACEMLAEQSLPSRFQVDCYGSASDETEQACRKHPTIRLMGVVDNAAYRSTLASYDAFVYPSVYDNEGHPGAVIEAMLSGLPVICTSLPTVMEIVSNDVEGLVVEPGSADSLARAMSQIITDRSLRDRLAAAAGRKGLSFDEDVVIPQLLRAMGLSGGEVEAGD